MNNQAVSIKEVIEKFLPQKPKSVDAPKSKILENWSKIVPQKADDCSQPAFIKNKVLVVTVSNSAWLHQLTLQKQQIMKNIEKFAGKDIICDLRFRLGKINAPAHR